MRLLTDQVLLAAAVPGFDVGDAEADESFTFPYSVVYPLFTADLDGPLSDVTADGWYQYQVTCVGETREQAQGLADATEPALEAYAYTVANYAIGPAQLNDRLPVDRDDGVQPPLFYQTLVFQYFVTPSP